MEHLISHRLWGGDSFPSKGKLPSSTILRIMIQVKLMNHLTNPNLKHFAQELRKNMTKEERKLWYQFLRGLPIQFRRQTIIGDYIIDFYCGSKKIAVELDGSQHFEEEGLLHDRKRDVFLNQQGITVLRYSNSDVNSRFEGVCEDILQHLEI